MEHTAPPRLLTIKQGAERLTIGRTQVYRLIAAGQLPVVKLLGATRLREDDLAVLIDTHTITR
jgi:excisionase family DNA binding protein